MSDEMLLNGERSHIELIAKSQARQYVHEVLLGTKAIPHIFWTMYFRDGIKSTEVADSFAVLLGNIFSRQGKQVAPLNAYPLAVACEQNKVLFWQLLKGVGSPLMVPKELFRFSTFAKQQISKLANFVRDLPHKKFIIKPVDSNLTSGILVIPRDELAGFIQFLVKQLKQFNMQLKAEESFSGGLFIDWPTITAVTTMVDIRKILCPDFEKQNKLTKKLVDIELMKFVSYWFGIDRKRVIGDERDFFLIEAFVAPLKNRVYSDGEIAGEAVADVAVADRAFFMRSDAVPVPKLLSLSAKSAYDPDKVGGAFDFVSSCDNYYSYNLSEKDRDNLIKSRTSVGERSDQTKQQVSKAFNQPRTTAWIEKLMTCPVGAFLEEIKASNVDNPEVLAYLMLDSVRRLDFDRMSFCWQCFAIKPVENLSVCTQCKLAMYCDKTCQREDWKAHHKTECKQLIA